MTTDASEGRCILKRLQELDDDPSASYFVGDVAADAIAEIKRLRAMTTDADEGRRQAEAMKPEPLKVGDKVRLAAGGERVMFVFGVKDYGNQLECEWYELNPGGLDPDKGYSYEELSGMSDTVRRFDTFPARSLVKVEDGNAPAPAAGEAAEAPKHRPQEGHAEQGQG